MIYFSKNLPIFNQKEEIKDAIYNNQVVIIAGETGSGKTTQIPKICMEIGRGKNGLIGHTQPRRIAAQSIAKRISYELNVPFGTLVGYKIRFSDRINSSVLIKLMTDGILLAELYSDKLLLQYDTLIIDEAHERSLNIDFILGYLHSILSFRSDLKIIISSATIDSKLFSSYFNYAPIINIKGRSYPIDIRYRPIVVKKNNSKARINSIIKAILELYREPKGDIIIFLSNEKEIKDVFKEIKKINLFDTEILPIYASLSKNEQNKVFEIHKYRRIILSTNIAETSLTIPNVKYVIDTGYARISRYNSKTKVQHLPIEEISQASASQRTGRCGRTSSGICIRLYSKENFLSRPKHSDPEILRTNLVSVILQMIGIGLVDIEKFFFIEKPKKRDIKYSIKLLRELNAVVKNKLNNKYELTEIGINLIKLPIDPHLGRMILEAQKYNCVYEIMVISSALSIQDPRERLFGKEEIIRRKHSVFIDKNSDFLTFLNLWKFIEKKRNILSKNDFLNECNKYFLNFIRLNEWKDIYQQLKRIIESIKISINTHPADYKSIHVSLLSGFFLNIGRINNNKINFCGVFGSNFFIFPGSVLFKKRVKWVVVAKFIKTNKFWGCIAAKIKPEWVELVLKHLLKYSYKNPFWFKRGGIVKIEERVKLFNLYIIKNREINYSMINPIFCRRLFINHALLKREINKKYSFHYENTILINKIKKLENKIRKNDILVDDKFLYNFYESKIKSDIVSLHEFDIWWNKFSTLKPNLLTFNKDMLMRYKLDPLFNINYPDYWKYGSFNFRLTYLFDTKSKNDGVTVHIPIFLLNQIKYKGFDFNILGFRKDLIINLIKLLPKKIKNLIKPINEFCNIFLEKFSIFNENLLCSMKNTFKDITGFNVDFFNWRWDKLPNYLKITFNIYDEKDKFIFQSKNFFYLKKKLENIIKKKMISIFDNIEKNNIIAWDFDFFPKVCKKKYFNCLVKVYPALVDKNNSVSIKIFLDKKEQLFYMKKGLNRILLISILKRKKNLYSKFMDYFKLSFFSNSFFNKFNSIEDCIFCVLDQLIMKFGGLVWNKNDYFELESYIFLNFEKFIFDVFKKMKEILCNLFLIKKILEKNIKYDYKDIYFDVIDQINFLVFKGFFTEHGYEKILDIVRYVNGIKIRLENIINDPNKDKVKTDKLNFIKKFWNEFLVNNSLLKLSKSDKNKIFWMIEEFRISLFAQKLGTLYSISEKKIINSINKIEFFNYL